MSEPLNHLLAAGGGAIGATLRWLAGLLAVRCRIPAWWAILLVNTVGCLVMGIASGVIRGAGVEAFLLAGVLGGFTTFSTASLDVWVLWRSGARASALCCLVATPVLAIAAMFIGIGLVSGVAA